MRLFRPPRLVRMVLRVLAAKPSQPSVPIRSRPCGEEVPTAIEPVLQQTPQIVALQRIRGRCWVIDGDTIVIGHTHIRLAGIDAPELDQPYGLNAKYAMMALCRGQVVTAEVEDGMTYGRVVARCHLPDGTDLSAALVAQGLALDWAKFSGGAYRHLEPDGIRKKLWRVEAKHRGRLPQR